MGTLWVQQCISPLVFEIVRERNDAAMSTLFEINYYGLVTPYNAIDHGDHWFR